jgi:hypothetical protein
VAVSVAFWVTQTLECKGFSDIYHELRKSLASVFAACWGSILAGTDRDNAVGLVLKSSIVAPYISGQDANGSKSSITISEIFMAFCLAMLVIIYPPFYGLTITQK